MTFPEDGREMCVFVDTSQDDYLIILTGVEEWNNEMRGEEQDHRLTIGKGRVFRDSQVRWSIIDKKAYPIIRACQDLSNELQRTKCFRLLCDPSSNIYVFAPGAELKKHIRDRLQRWSMRLCGMRYAIEHIPGASNLWSDIVSRWHTSPSVTTAAGGTRLDRPAPVTSPFQLNGTVERLNKGILQAMRMLLVEYGLDIHEWCYLLPVGQANLDYTLMRSLGGHAPIEVFTGLPASSALDTNLYDTSQGMK
ncbi:hypothetical protein PC123_g21115 [Phytophthora cactorum]|nr:hypothetical protein PC123_g21115 [Phytophthora cactorum]